MTPLLPGAEAGVITITTPDGRLLATQCGQTFYTPQGSCIPAGPARWGLQDMLRLWGDMCSRQARPTSFA